MNQNQILLLNEITADAEPEQVVLKSFTSLAKKTNLTAPKVDELLEELEKQRFITMFVVAGSDEFKIRIHASAFSV